MRFTVKRSAFTEQIGLVSSIIRSKRVLPMLGYIKLDSDFGLLKATACDLDCFYTRSIQTITGEVCSMLVPARDVREWLGVVTGETVSITLKDNRLELSTPESGIIRLSTLEADKFPTVGGPDFKPFAEANFKDLQLIKSCIMDEDGGRPQLESVFIEHENDWLICAATEGHKVGTVRIEAELAEGGAGICLPGKYVDLVSGLGKCSVAQSDNLLMFSNDSASVVLRKPEHGIAPWRKATTMHEYVGQCAVIREELAQAVAQCHILRGRELGSERGVRVELSPVDGGIRVLTTIDGTGDSYSTTLASKLVGDVPSITLGTEHLVPFFNLPCDDLLKIDFTGSYTVVHMNAGAADYWFCPFVPRGTQEAKPK